jgi:hypothetical protein
LKKNKKKEKFLAYRSVKPYYWRSFLPGKEKKPRGTSLNGNSQVEGSFNSDLKEEF